MDNGPASQTVPWDWKQLDHKFASFQYHMGEGLQQTCRQRDMICDKSLICATLMTFVQRSLYHKLKNSGFQRPKEQRRVRAWKASNPSRPDLQATGGSGRCLPSPDLIPCWLDTSYLPNRRYRPPSLRPSLCKFSLRVCLRPGPHPWNHRPHPKYY